MMRELEVKRSGINMAEDAIDHRRTISYKEDDDFTKIIKKELVNKAYFPPIGQIIWEISTPRDLDNKGDTLKIGYVLNIKRKWFVATTIASSEKSHITKMSDIIKYCEYNKSSFNRIDIKCTWVYDIR